ncbi:MAG: EamA family transporter [Lachnospiraceae bacterium]|nr:EamA family transporter [Lachnospiraceae bacterium]
MFRNLTDNQKLVRLMPLAVMILWGSMYVANRVIMQSMPALILLFIRFSVSGALLFGFAKCKGLKMFRKEDLGELLIISFAGYFVCEGSLLLATQYSSAGYASLLNALSPITISVFAVFMLGEKLAHKEIFSLLLAVAGAFVIIGNPGDGVTLAGTLFSLISLVFWSYVTIRIKKLSAKYDPIVITGSAMAIASLPALPAGLIYMHVTGETVRFSAGLVLPLIYVCLICTALAHLLWNTAMSKGAATGCAAFYPFQPLTSMALGIVLLGERCSRSFLAGAMLILLSIMVRQARFHFSFRFKPAVYGLFHM